MAAINGVVIPGTLVPTDTTDTYAVTDSTYGIDGLRSVADKTARNAITQKRRRQGMVVVVQQDFGTGPNTVWQLKAPPWNNTDTDWTLLISAIAPNEVFVGPDDPLDPATELWFDIDAVDTTIPQGPPGPEGPQGDPGVGVPIGGLTNQVLTKSTDLDYETQWSLIAHDQLTGLQLGDDHTQYIIADPTTLIRNRIQAQGDFAGLTIQQSASSLTANLQEWWDQGGGVLSYVAIDGTFTGSHAGDGAGITNLNAYNLASGMVPTARLGSGTARSNTFLAGNNTWQSVATVGKTTWVIASGTPITVGADQTAWAILDQARTMSKVYVCAKSSPAGADIILDILYSTDNGVTFTSLWAINPGYRPIIAIGSKFSTTTTFDTTVLPAGALLRLDVVQVGSTVGSEGQDVTVQLQYQ